MKTSIVVAFLALPIAQTSSAQSVTPINFAPLPGSVTSGGVTTSYTTFAYSAALDRLILLSANPTGANQLHIYNPAGNSDVTVPIPAIPAGLAISPDGLHAAVASPYAVFYVNLQTGVIAQTCNVTVIYTPPTYSANHLFSAVVLGPQYLYVLNSQSGATFNAVSINLANAMQSTSTAFAVTTAVYSPLDKAVYFPLTNGYEKLDVSTGPITAATSLPESLCGPTYLAADNRLYDGCGAVVQTSTDPSVNDSFILFVELYGRTER